MHELIDTLERFRAIKQQDVVVLNDDSARKRYHHADCRHLDERNFIQKLSGTGGANGSYFLVSEPSDASVPEDSICGTCREEVLRLRAERPRGS